MHTAMSKTSHVAIDNYQLWPLLWTSHLYFDLLEKTMDISIPAPESLNMAHQVLNTSKHYQGPLVLFIRV
jgi:hypothetical protein